MRSLVVASLIAAACSPAPPQGEPKIRSANLFRAVSHNHVDGPGM